MLERLSFSGLRNADTETAWVLRVDRKRLEQTAEYALHASAHPVKSVMGKLADLRIIIARFDVDFECFS